MFGLNSNKFVKQFQNQLCTEFRNIRRCYGMESSGTPILLLGGGSLGVWLDDHSIDLCQTLAKIVISYMDEIKKRLIHQMLNICGSPVFHCSANSVQRICNLIKIMGLRLVILALTENLQTSYLKILSKQMRMFFVLYRPDLLIVQVMPVPTMIYWLNEEQPITIKTLANFSRDAKL